MRVIERMAIAISNLRSSLNRVLLYSSQFRCQLLHYTCVDRQIVTGKKLAVYQLFPLPRSSLVVGSCDYAISGGLNIDRYSAYNLTPSLPAIVEMYHNSNSHSSAYPQSSTVN